MASDTLKEHGISIEILRDSEHPGHVDQSYKFASLMAAGAIDEGTVNAVSMIAPHITRVVEVTANSALQSQLQVSQNQGQSARALAEVVAECARKAKSDEAIMQIASTAAQMNRDNNQASVTMNGSNNGSYKELATIAASVAVLAFVGWQKLR